MVEYLSGKPVVEKMREDMKQKSDAFKAKGIEPCMWIFRVGERGDDVSYEKSIMKSCESVGIKAVQKPLPVDISQDDLIAEIKKANTDNSVHGIMLFRPLPDHIDTAVIENTLNPDKDIDCMTSLNLAKVFDGSSKLNPCTAQAVVTLLKHHKIPLAGKHVVVVGRSLVVGKPLVMLLLNENATVTVCHSKTANLEEVTKNCDVVAVAMGKKGLLKAKHFTKDSIVVDVGMHWDDEKKTMVGDVDYDDVKDLIKHITPSVGGVGVVTTNILLYNTVNACEHLNK